MYIYIYICIYLSLLFIKIASDFNPSCLSPTQYQTFEEQIFSNGTHET